LHWQPAAIEKPSIPKTRALCHDFKSSGTIRSPVITDDESVYLAESIESIDLFDSMDRRNIDNRDGLAVFTKRLYVAGHGCSVGQFPAMWAPGRRPTSRMPRSWRRSKKLPRACGGNPRGPPTRHTVRGLVPRRDAGGAKEQAHLSLGEERFTPRAAHDQRTQSTCLFGAVCPERGASSVPVLQVSMTHENANQRVCGLRRLRRCNAWACFGFEM